MVALGTDYFQTTFTVIDFGGFNRVNQPYG